MSYTSDIRDDFVNNMVEKVVIIALAIIALVLTFAFEANLNKHLIQSDNYIEVTAQKIDVTSNTVENNDFGFLYAQQQARKAGESTFSYNDTMFSTYEDYSNITTYKVTYEFNLEDNNHKLAYTYDKESDIPETMELWIRKDKAEEIDLQPSDILNNLPKTAKKVVNITVVIIRIAVLTILFTTAGLTLWKIFDYKQSMKKAQAEQKEREAIVNLSKGTKEKAEAN